MATARGYALGRPERSPDGRPRTRRTTREGAGGRRRVPNDEADAFLASFEFG
ncbi:MAG: hypothetical protein ACRD0R_16690 [Acidimicrobiales bacterium]